MGTGSDLWNQVEALYNKGDMGASASLMTDDVVLITPIGRHDGREALRAYLEEWDKLLSDMRLETSLVLEDGDAVVAEWTLRFTVTGHPRLRLGQMAGGPLPTPDGGEIAPTGKVVEYSAMSVLRLRHGKIASWRDYYDSADLTRQLSG
jgi:ketosteroid isomerase-like protein